MTGGKGEAGRWPALWKRLVAKSQGVPKRMEKSPEGSAVFKDGEDLHMLVAGGMFMRGL